MYYTGIDLHKKTSFITTIDQRGKVVFKKNFKNQEEIILPLFVFSVNSVVTLTLLIFYFLSFLLSSIDMLSKHKPFIEVR